MSQTLKVPFVGPAYQARSANVDAQRAVNCYLEMDPASPTRPLAMYGTPGLLLRVTLGVGPIRAMVRQGSYAYIVAGSAVYRMDTNYVATSIGSVGTSIGPLGMCTNGTQVLIVDGTNGWLATDTGYALITDPDFPVGVTSCGYLNGFFLVAGDGSGRFYFNETPGDGAVWNGLDFASAEGNPDELARLIITHLECWFVGSYTTEIFTNTGNPDSPFERNGGAYLETGTCAKWSVASMDNTTYWLGQDEAGVGIVYRAQGYSPVRVSTHALESALAGYTLSDAQAFCLQFHGHAWYVLTFPTSDATWVYDAATQSWFEWSWRNPSTNADHRHRANCHLYFGGEHLVGDWETGDIYALSEETYTDNDDPIRRLRATATLDSLEGGLVFYEELLIQMETGVGLATGQGSDPLLMLRYSNDSGHSWSGVKTKSIGQAGRYADRVKFGPLGSGRNRVFEVSMTDPVKFVLIGASARVSKQ